MKRECVLILGKYPPIPRKDRNRVRHESYAYIPRTVDTGTGDQEVNVNLSYTAVQAHTEVLPQQREFSFPF